MSYFKSGLVSGILMLLMSVTPPASAQTTYTFGIVPQQAASELAEKWSPVLAWLSKRSGVALQFATAPDVPTFEQRLAASDYDFAYMNPYHFTVFNDKPGYKALVRAKGERIKGLIVVHKDSSIKSLKDLSGKELAFPTPAAFAACLLVQGELRKQKIAFTPVVVQSHNSVYRNVAKGIYVAGGGVPRTLELLDESLRNDLRVLWETPEYTTHAIASKPKLDPAVRDKVLRAMEQMSADPEGLALLSRIGFKGFELARDKDWDDVRRLHIRPADSLIKSQ